MTGDRPEGFKQEIYTKSYITHTNEKKVLADLLRKYLGGWEFESFLDIGPGEGVVTREVAKRSQKTTVVEADGRFCEKLRKALPDAEVINSSITDAGFDGGAFDFVLCSHVLYFVPLHQWNPLLARIISWVKPGGRLMVILNSSDSEWYRTALELSQLLRIMPGFAYYDPQHLFGKFTGGPSETLTYESHFEFGGFVPDIREFLIEYFLCIPRELFTEEQRRLTDRFIEMRLGESGKFRMNFKHVAGVWKR